MIARPAHRPVEATPAHALRGRRVQLHMPMPEPGPPPAPPQPPPGPEPQPPEVIDPPLPGEDKPRIDPIPPAPVQRMAATVRVRLHSARRMS